MWALVATPAATPLAYWKKLAFETIVPAAIEDSDVPRPFVSLGDFVSADRFSEDLHKFVLKYSLWTLLHLQFFNYKIKLESHPTSHMCPSKLLELATILHLRNFNVLAKFRCQELRWLCQCQSPKLGESPKTWYSSGDTSECQECL